ncbi:MAG TPA: COX15/CtaA family protein [Candidatus Kapabacteria bacterium]|nr:COX15/CtaA family protein [Candidatus Kapabacteria bacterium]
MNSTTRSRFVHVFAVITAIATLCLIFVGALVTSHDAGLSVPDWPNTYGQFMYTFPIDQWRANIFYEHTHRLFASLVGFLILVQATLLWRNESRTWVKRLGWTALGAVVAQGVLGGLTVIFLLPTWISTTHAALAQTTLCLATAIAIVTSPRWDDDQIKLQDTSSSLRSLTKITVAAIFLQLVIGAWMRHKSAGLAIPTFPLSNGNILPEFTSIGVTLNFLHRTWAFVVAILVYITSIRTLRAFRNERSVRTPAIAAMILVLVQISLGAITIWSAKEPNWTSAHVVTGAAILMTELILAIRVHHRLHAPHIEPTEQSSVAFTSTARS